jgi:hypothetical protein
MVSFGGERFGVGCRVIQFPGSFLRTGAVTPLSRLRFLATTTWGMALIVSLGAAALIPIGRVFFLGLGLVALLEIPSYWALSLTIRLSNSKFFGAFVGGLFGRLLGLGAGVGFVWRYDRGGVVPFVLAAVVGLIGFSFIEMFFIGRQNRLPI